MKIPVVVKKNDVLLKRKNRTTLVLNEEGEERIENALPIQYIEEACLRFFSTMDGRMHAAQEILHIRQKVPVCVSELTHEIWFPSRSPSQKDCIWLKYNAIFDYQAIHQQKTLIQFYSSKEI
ncbi:MAG: competence protein ComK, partial [Solobacterium sp.]|nr:competence protein ComK [Solobacterium sp.]